MMTASTSVPKSIITTGTFQTSIKGIEIPCTTYYKVYGPLPSPAPPVIILHGGPGATHQLHLSMADLCTVHGITTIFYDQLGCGKSTHFPERRGDESFWTDELFMTELHSLLSYFDLGGTNGKPYYVLGQSWGGMLAARFAATPSSDRPRLQGLQRLVLSNTPASQALWMRSAEAQVKGLPLEMQEAIRKHEAAGTTDSPEYQAAVWEHFRRHGCRVELPKEWMDAVKGVMEDNTVYRTMSVFSDYISSSPTIRCAYLKLLYR
jgi:proline-specific peptidase